MTLRRNAAMFIERMTAFSFSYMALEMSLNNLASAYIFAVVKF